MVAIGPQNAVVVSRRQAGNPLLKHIRNVRWTWGDIVPDYLLGATSCALFLSLRCAVPGGLH
jgi:DNA excision repair protein ERCC-1